MDYQTASQEANDYDRQHQDKPEPQPVKIVLCPHCGFDIESTCTCEWTEEMILDYERTK